MNAITIHLKTADIQKMLVLSASQVTHCMHFSVWYTILKTILLPSVIVVVDTLTLLPIGRGDSVFEGGDGTLEVCVESVSGALSGDITLVISSGYNTAQGKYHSSLFMKIMCHLYPFSLVEYDYTEFTGEILLYRGDVSACQTFNVILDDNILEDPELFVVFIYPLGNANLTRSYGIVTIVDNESEIFAGKHT